MADTSTDEASRKATLMQSIVHEVIMDNHPPDTAWDRVIDNLCIHGVSVVENGDLHCTLHKAGVVEEQRFTKRVSRHRIGRLSAKFNIGMGSFFQPPDC